MHAPTDGGERAAGGAHAALVTRALHQGDSASRFNYLDLVTAKSGKLIIDIDLTDLCPHCNYCVLIDHFLNFASCYYFCKAKLFQYVIIKVLI